MAEKVRATATGGKRPRRTKDSGARVDDESALWKRIIRACETEFQETFGIPWNPKLVGLGKCDSELEDEARRIYSQLRHALKEAVRFVEKPEVQATRVGAPAVLSLRSWVPRSIAPMLRHTWMEDLPEDPEVLPEGQEDVPEDPKNPAKRRKKRWPPNRAPRARLIRILDDFNVLGLAEAPDGSSRFLTVREMALVSLLAGNRPELGDGPLAYNVGEVIKLESANIRPLLKKHGKPDITDADRGPDAAKAPGKMRDDTG